MNGRTATPDSPGTPAAAGDPGDAGAANGSATPTGHDRADQTGEEAGPTTPSGTGPPSTGDRPRRHWLRHPRRPRLWFELALIAVSYWAYSLVRNAVPERVELAQNHARWIWEAQERLGLAFERAVNHAINDVTWLIVVVNYFYATLHFAVTIAVLVWLFRRHPGRYAAVRLVLFVTTLVALVGYYTYPLAPPRLMDGMDFVDTGLVHNTWGSLSSEAMQSVSNQYAAMPSMHMGWALWSGVTIVWLARAPWLRVLGALYPVATLFVIIATANHFWLDAVGGLACLAVGYLAVWAWYGQLCYRLPRTLPSPAGATSARPAPTADRSRAERGAVAHHTSDGEGVPPDHGRDGSEPGSPEPAAEQRDSEQRGSEPTTPEPARARRRASEQPEAVIQVTQDARDRAGRGTSA